MHELLDSDHITGEHNCINIFEIFFFHILLPAKVIFSLAHLSRRLIGELIVYRLSRRLLTLSNMNISATSWPIGMKFYLKHHWAEERLQKVLIQIRSELWFPWQQIAPIEL